MADIPECEEKMRLEGLVEVFQRYRKALAKAVARIVKPGDIEDIVQETYLRLYQAAKRQPIRHPKSFMLKAARNLALSHVVRADAMNHLGTQGVQFERDAEADRFERQQVAFESPEAEAQAEEEFLIFCRAIRELPLQCRRAFLLRKVYGLSQDEVARELRISESTVEKHIAKGLIACSTYMAANGYARPSATAGTRPNRRKVGAE
jgi:RNA polymerase sigma factor (sigma-70 family)